MIVEMNQSIARINNLPQSDRIEILKKKMLDEPRFVSIEQARIITEVYQAHPGKPVILKRALSLRNTLERLEIAIQPVIT